MPLHSTAASTGTTASLTLHAGALVLVYSMYSLLQEKVMKAGYGEAQERFTSSALLVLSNRLSSLLAGLAFSFLLPLPRSGTAPSGRKEMPALLETASTTRLHLVRPAWPIYFYALVAAANFASTFSQYEALRWVGFTTQALAKCAKMVPVLILGKVFYRKTYKTKEYFAGCLVVIGCCIYLFSGAYPPGQPGKHSTRSSSDHDSGPFAAIIGGSLLASYLFFDGLTSTTQEHYFGKSRSDQNTAAHHLQQQQGRHHPLVPGGPVLDQMIYVNASAALISLICCLLESDKFWQSLALMSRNREVCIDVLMLSATATLGLVILYDTIFKHGALNVATTMTLRQFFSILLNAGVFGHLDTLGIRGWIGVGLVAVGVFVKMSKRFDGVQPLPAHIITSEKHIGNASQSLPTYGTTVDSRQAESAGTSSFGSRYLDGLLLWPAVYLSFVRITKNRQTFFGRS